MAYYDQSLLSQDWDFQNRVAACSTTEVDAVKRGEQHPLTWAVENLWLIAAAPGFADAYASAVIAGIENPGRDPSVISDAQILSAVQALLAGQTPTTTQEVHADAR